MEANVGVMWSEDGRREHEPKIQETLEVRKGKETDSALELPERMLTSFQRN